MVRHFGLAIVIFAIWFWIIITWIHVTIQALNLNGYVYQPYKKYPSIVRKSFIVILYPFCCKPITDEYEIRLVPFKEAFKRLLVTTLLWLFATFLVSDKLIILKEWICYQIRIKQKR